jgi:hypothetical protein
MPMCCPISSLSWVLIGSEKRFVHVQDVIRGSRDRDAVAGTQQELPGQVDGLRPAPGDWLHRRDRNAQCGVRHVAPLPRIITETGAQVVRVGVVGLLFFVQRDGVVGALPTARAARPRLGTNPGSRCD